MKKPALTGAFKNTTATFGVCTLQVAVLFPDCREGDYSLSNFTVKWRISSVSQTIFTPRFISLRRS